eukprot:3804978-Rhodomonas_salina.1
MSRGVVCNSTPRVHGLAGGIPCNNAQRFHGLMGGIPGSGGAAAGHAARGCLRCAPIRLRACYAMSGTDLACGGICLRACYATPGTDL